MSETTTITWLGGVKILDPVKYEIMKKKTGKWWWQKDEYYLQSPFATLGPFDSEDEIRRLTIPAGIEIQERRSS